MNEHQQDQHDESLHAAREDVARAEARLSNRWRAAKVAGEKSVGRAMTVVRPVVVGVAVAGGLIWLVSAITRRGRTTPRRFSALAEPPSLLSEMTRAAALALASAGARHLADRYLSLPAAANIASDHSILKKPVG
jgi:hypothetical protein